MMENCLNPCKRVKIQPVPKVIGDTNTNSKEIPEINTNMETAPSAAGKEVNFNEIENVLTDIPAPPIEEPATLAARMKAADFAVTEYKRADESVNPPCYLPQPEDSAPVCNNIEPMGPVGPWATGKVDWSPLGGLTGTRPVVDQYSITRYSTNEWRQKNKDIFNEAFNTFENAAKVINDGKDTINRTNALIDKSQNETTKMVRERAQLVARWKESLERAIKAMAEEISTMEVQRARLKSSLTILKTPHLIASECLALRSTRPDKELIRDRPEEELIRELAMISEIRVLLEKTLADITQQQIENRAARNRLEYDWSDKKDAYELELLNVSYNNFSKTTVFRPGATRLDAEQSSQEYWEHFTKETLDESERCRQMSINLRSTLDALLMNAARDLRNQADTVEKAFHERIDCMQENVNRLENELKYCLQTLADTENRIIALREGMVSLDKVAKLTQSRLYNKNSRPHVENCRDHTLNGLVNEVKITQDGVSSILAAMEQSQQSKLRLMNTRSDLERDLMLKKRCLVIDRQRCMLLRSLFPSTKTLTGL
ncbi:tektin-4 [Condylostylus longicornis]|uniref:tektin-4 n=1 Tax=Condylostylus longicornis TaxID=2530218 RepID=UPI00244DAEA8|nr:tektin-4 [Condylostylus longicornis]